VKILSARAFSTFTAPEPRGRPPSRLLHAARYTLQTKRACALVARCVTARRYTAVTRCLGSVAEVDRQCGGVASRSVTVTAESAYAMHTPRMMRHAQSRQCAVRVYRGAARAGDEIRCASPQLRVDMRYTRDCVRRVYMPVAARCSAMPPAAPYGPRTAAVMSPSRARRVIPYDAILLVYAAILMPRRASSIAA